MFFYLFSFLVFLFTCRYSVLLRICQICFFFANLSLYEQKLMIRTCLWIYLYLPLRWIPLVDTNTYVPQIRYTTPNIIQRTKCIYNAYLAPNFRTCCPHIPVLVNAVQRTFNWHYRWGVWFTPRNGRETPHCITFQLLSVGIGAPKRKVPTV